MDVAASWQSAQAALARRDMPEARRHLLAVLERQPAHAYARVMLAGTVLAQGRLREAVQQLQLAAVQEHDDPAENNSCSVEVDITINNVTKAPDS